MPEKECDADTVADPNSVFEADGVLRGVTVTVLFEIVIDGVLVAVRGSVSVSAALHDSDEVIALIVGVSATLTVRLAIKVSEGVTVEVLQYSGLEALNTTPGWDRMRTLPTR